MKLLLENWRKYIEEDALEEGLLDFFKKKEEEGEEVVPPIPKAYIKSLRSARSRRMRHLDPRDMYNVPYISWLQNKHTPWMRELELSADNNTLSLKTAQKIADRLLSVEWRGHQHPINQEAIDKAREKIKSDFNDLFVRLGAQQGGLSVLPPEEGEGALSYADSEGGLSMTEQWRKYLNEGIGGNPIDVVEPRTSHKNRSQGEKEFKKAQWRKKTDKEDFRDWRSEIDRDLMIVRAAAKEDFDATSIYHSNYGYKSPDGIPEDKFIKKAVEDYLTGDNKYLQGSEREHMPPPTGIPDKDTMKKYFRKKLGNVGGNPPGDKTQGQYHGDRWNGGVPQLPDKDTMKKWSRKEWEERGEEILAALRQKGDKKALAKARALFRMYAGPQRGGLSFSDEDGRLSIAQDADGQLSMTEQWRRYLAEEVQYSGILKLKPTPEIISQAKAAMADLPPEAVPLPDKALHITLIHQNILKPYRKQLKGMALPPEPEVILAPGYEEKADEALGRKSWVVQVENQEDLREYVNEVMALVKGPPDPEPNRIFHITLANLTGNAGDSVK